MTTPTNPVTAIIGVGPGNGAAAARAFAKAGHAVALLARDAGFIDPLAVELDAAVAIRCDVTDSQSLDAAFAAIRERLGEVDTLVYNVGSAHWGSIDELDADAFETDWRTNACGLFVAAQQVIPAMQARGRGNILVVSAGAAHRGRPGTASFAPAKAAQNSLAQSLARHLGPQGIHVATVLIDGVVDLPRTREAMPDKPDSFFVQPAAVADNLLWLARQDASAWSFEIDVRPFAEKW